MKRNLLLWVAVLFSPSAFAGPGSSVIRVVTISPSGGVQVAFEGRESALKTGESAGPWTLMAVIKTGLQRRAAVFEDFTQKKGGILVVDTSGVSVSLPKSFEPTFAERSSLYRGHSLAEVVGSDTDLLGGEILARPGDPDYDEIARCFPPISKMPTYTFVGTHDGLDKPGFQYGGRTSNFDPAVFIPAIDAIRKAGKVSDGLVGGWLPVVRFVYPEESGAWTEMLAYAPMRFEDGNRSVQPVWYRLVRVERNALKWVRYFDSYQPYPPRVEHLAEPFYEELLAMRTGWNRYLAPGMKIDIPDRCLADMARHSLVRDMITRIGPYPKYGVFDRNYGGNAHDGFPDTFNADTAAMLDWGLLDLAGQYIDNYFSKFVRDDGSILYRGPETGQYGRMLTVVAQYANYGGDPKVLLKNRRRIDGVAKLLLSMREKALKLPPGDPAYGMIAGWSEADACLEPDPPRYMQPYFSNTTEAQRGFRDLGEVWDRFGKRAGNSELAAWGQSLIHHSEALNKDIQTAIARSILKDTTPVCLPAIAGVRQPFDVAAAQDKYDPQFRSYRAYMEMLYSGNLSRQQVEMIVRYRAAHRDTILGVPTAYGYDTHELAGFLTYGHGYGLLQHDFIREYLLTLYSIMAHQYTRGTWTAPETRSIDPQRNEGPYIDPQRDAAPYCTPAQLVVPMFVRWMLVFEDPQSQTVWLDKGAPRAWLEDGKKIAVENAPTKYGPIGYTIESRLNSGEVNARVLLPAAPFAAAVKLRLRVPEGHQIRTVTVDGKPWTRFDTAEETVTLPAMLAGEVSVAVRYGQE